MASTVLIIIVLLWFLGFIQIPYIHSTLFTLLGKPITLYTILLFLIIAWIIEILPSPLRQIVFILFLLWVLSVLGIFTFTGLSQALVVAIIIGLLLSFF